MDTVLQALDESINAIRSLSFAKDEQQPLPFVSLDISALIREYCEFLSALKKCKITASDDYDDVCTEMQSVNALNNDLSRLKAELKQINFGSSIRLADNQSSEDEQSQEETGQLLQETMNKYSANFTEAIRGIGQKVKELKNDNENFKIVLFGRTKVGKSTVREALTHGNGSTIGKGGQSTTLENHEYEWFNLHVYDTPGILSVRDTNKDERNSGIGDEEKKAYELLQRADIALFMFASDNIEKAELDYLHDIAEKSKDVLILLNVKSDISDYRMYKLRHKEKELEPSAQQGHINRIRSCLPKRFPILPIHAQAGFFSRARDNNEIEKFFDTYQVSQDELYELSHFADIRSYLVKSILERGCPIRCKTIWNYFIDNVKKFASDNGDPIEAAKRTVDKMSVKIENANNKIERLIANTENNCFNKIHTMAKDRINTFDFATECIEYKYKKDEIEYRWKSQLESLADLPKTLIQEFFDEAMKTLDELKNELSFIADTSTQFDGYEIGIDWKNWLRWGGAAVGIGSSIYVAIAAANSWNPIGWVMIGIGVLGAVLSFLAGLFKSKEKKVAELNQKLSDSLYSVSQNISNQVFEYCNKGNKDERTGLFDGKGPFQMIRAKLATALDNQRKMKTICERFLELNGKLEQISKKSEMTLKQRLVKLRNY